MKLEIGKKYNLDTISINTPAILINVTHDNQDYIFDKDGKIFLAKKCQIISEYTEPEKLSGWINVYESEIGISREEADHFSTVRKSKRLACIDLSQFNVGEGL